MEFIFFFLISQGSCELQTEGKRKQRNKRASVALVLHRVFGDELRVGDAHEYACSRTAHGSFCFSSHSFGRSLMTAEETQSASYCFSVSMFPSKLLSSHIPQMWYKALSWNKQGYWTGLVWNALKLLNSPLPGKVLSRESLVDCPSLRREVKNEETSKYWQGVNSRQESRNDTKRSSWSCAAV